MAIASRQYILDTRPDLKWGFERSSDAWCLVLEHRGPEALDNIVIEFSDCPPAITGMSDLNVKGTWVLRAKLSLGETLVADVHRVQLATMERAGGTLRCRATCTRDGATWTVAGSVEVPNLYGAYVALSEDPPENVYRPSHRLNI